MSSKGVLIAFADEIHKSEAVAKSSIEAITESEPDNLASFIDEYSDLVNRISSVAESINLSSLQEFMEFINKNMALFCADPAIYRSKHKVSELLKGWPRVLVNFLKDCKSEKAVHEVHQFFILDDWLCAIESERVIKAITDIQNFYDDSIGDEKEQAEFSEKDVSTEISSDTSPGLLIAFQEELPQNVNVLLEKHKKLKTASFAADDIMHMRKVVHTLKGAANMVGVIGITNIACLLENIFDILVEKKALPSNKLIYEFSKAFDCLSEMSDAALSDSEPPENVLDALNHLVKLKRIISSDQDTDYVTHTEESSSAALKGETNDNTFGEFTGNASKEKEYAKTISLSHSSISNVKITSFASSEISSKDKIKHGENLYEIVYLSNLLEINKITGLPMQRQNYITILISADGRDIALIIDEENNDFSSLNTPTQNYSVYALSELNKILFTNNKVQTDKTVSSDMKQY